jgi:hypothetical protein
MKHAARLWVWLTREGRDEEHRHEDQVASLRSAIKASHSGARCSVKCDRQRIIEFNSRGRSILLLDHT